MSIESIRLNLLNLKKVGIISVKGKSGTKRCVVIPIDDNNIYEGEKGAYLSLIAMSSDKLADGKSHLIKRSIKKEVYEKMTQEERNSEPIVGDIKPMNQVPNSISNVDEYMQEPEGSDDLPF